MLFIRQSVLFASITAVFGAVLPSDELVEMMSVNERTDLFQLAVAGCKEMLTFEVNESYKRHFNPDGVPQLERSIMDLDESNWRRNVQKRILQSCLKNPEEYWMLWDRVCKLLKIKRSDLVGRINNEYFDGELCISSEIIHFHEQNVRASKFIRRGQNNCAYVLVVAVGLFAFFTICNAVFESSTFVVLQIIMAIAAMFSDACILDSLTMGEFGLDSDSLSCITFRIAELMG